MNATALRPIHAIALPEGSVIRTALPGAHYADAYQTADPCPDASALQAWLDVVTRTPGWTRALMALRNKLARLVGLQDLGQLDDVHGTPRHPRDAASHRPGDRVGIFHIRHLSVREVVLGQDDKHLDVQVSLCKRQEGGQPVVVVSTVVHIHNTLGHAYMAVVTPFHRLIVRAMLRRLATASPHAPR
ncbi:MAG: hypothetical protein ABT02_09895 [Comamonadaceae bacterium SCN 68-20]|nr:MAG: hypothetical protein ABT02_09895 [Comamonadaceae bacterium SCN 68-20]OJX15662.1 MAG: hypothetical protein BGO75_16425 [Burkholderiales bacterium 68-20]